MPPVLVFAGASVVPTSFSLTLQIIPPALMLIAALVSTVLLALSSPSNRDRLVPNALLVLNIVLSAAAGGLCLKASLGHVTHFQLFSFVFKTLHGCLLSLSSLYVLFMATTPASLVRRAFRFMLIFVLAFLTCEIIAGSIPSTPVLLAPTFSLISRGLILPLAVGIFFDTRPVTHKSTATAPSIKTHEQRRSNHEGALRSPSFLDRSARVDSPTPETWPFPGSLAHTPSTYHRSSAKRNAVANLHPSRTLTATRYGSSVMQEGPSGRWRIPIIMLAAQIAAVMCAALDVTLEIPLATISGNATSWVASQVHNSLGRSRYFASPEVTDVAGFIIAHSVCSLVWVVAVVTGLYSLPSVRQASPTSLMLTGSSSFPERLPRTSEFTMVRTPKPSHSRFMPSDSASDFLSMRDPFASPPPPPAPPNVSLELEDIDHVQAHGVAPQYRFPAPKARKTKGGRKRRIGMRVKVLEHQASSRTLLPPRPSPAHTSGGDCHLNDEVLLAQLLLQSLTAGAEAEVEPGSPTSVAATNYSLPFPQPSAQKLGSRWSDSTALSVTASSPWCEKKSMTSTSTSEYARASRGKSSEARKSTDSGISISSSPST